VKLSLTNTSPDKTGYISVGTDEPCDPIFVGAGPSATVTYDVAPEQAEAIQRIAASPEGREFREIITISTKP